MVTGGTLAVLAACSPSVGELNEAYEVGFDLGLADRCTTLDRESMRAPKAYDDSLGSGRLADAFSSGYAEAKSIGNPCRCD